MDTIERLVRYCEIGTSASLFTKTRPSTPQQWELARLLKAEMEAIGISNVRLDDKCYLYGIIPATPGMEEAPHIGFIAHIDTAPDFNGSNVHPRVIENYDGSDIELGAGRFLHTSEFAHLKGMIGDTLVVTDGTSLLGADDKAGIAVIMTAAEEILNSAEPHGQICIAFNPDEEIGEGAWDFDVDEFDADYAYTIDAGEVGEVIYECFNGACAYITIHGFNIHPGSAKGKMVNAGLIATELASMLPADETPAKTEGYEGFFHLSSLSGNTEQAQMRYIIRDFDHDNFERRKSLLKDIISRLNAKYGRGTVEFTMEDQYLNMAEVIRDSYHLVENALEAAKEAGVSPVIKPIRGGTDGAQLTIKKGLPCPDLGEGGFAYHGPYEHASKKQMDQTVKIVKAIVSRYASPDSAPRIRTGNK